MKRLSTLFVALSIAAGSVLAQDVNGKAVSRWGFGAFGGVSHAFPRFSTPFARSEAQKNWLLGIDISRQMNSHSSVHSQPILMQFSNLLEDDGWKSPVFSLTTLKIPVLYRYYILPAR